MPSLAWYAMKVSFLAFLYRRFPRRFSGWLFMLWVASGCQVCTFSLNLLVLF
jgi:hypothetical protein